jgi:hypothetical protein
VSLPNNGYQPEIRLSCGIAILTESAETVAGTRGRKREAMSRKSKRTTTPGFVNRNGQVVVRATGLSGNDHGQSIYVLRCPTCEKEYGVNGSDIFQRRCPYHQNGASGLEY